MGDDAGTVTRLLQRWHAGDRAALDALIPLVYTELHQLAGLFIRGERPGHTFRATDLLSEAYLRLGGSEAPALTDRRHFFTIAARAMRQALIDHARRRSAGKRGGGERAIAFDEQLVGVERSDELLALDEALDALGAHDARKARVVELHYFGGLSQPEIADALAIHVNTVARDLRFAQAWIHRRLQGAAPCE